MKINRFALLLLLTLTGSVPAFSATTFTATGAINMTPTSMSDDASIVVGTGAFGTPNLYYTEARGASVIGDGCPSGVPSISGDGRTLLACHTDAQGVWNAALWLGRTNWQDLGTVEGGVPCDLFLSGSFGVNKDGSLGVGLLYLATLCKASAGTWDLVNGGPATVLPSLFGETTASRANAVNADGSVIVGWQDQLTGERTAAKWVNGDEELILTDDGGFNGEALAVNANGGAIVGTGYAFGPQAWIWRDGEGVSPIGRNGGDWVAVDVSDDGRVVVGLVRRGFSSGAFIWGKGSGASSLVTFITNRGAVVPAGWELTVASLISADGNTIYGWGFNPDGLIEMFKVELNAPAARPSH
jgi:uncharacterized membrane protein